MKAGPVYQIEIFGLDSKEKLHEYKSYDIPLENLPLTFIRQNGSVEKVTGNIKKVKIAEQLKSNDNPVPVDVFIEIVNKSSAAKSE